MIECFAMTCNFVNSSVNTLHKFYFVRVFHENDLSYKHYMIAINERCICPNRLTFIKAMTLHSNRREEAKRCGWVVCPFVAAKKECLTYAQTLV